MTAYLCLKPSYSMLMSWWLAADNYSAVVVCRLSDLPSCQSDFAGKTVVLVLLD